MNPETKTTDMECYTMTRNGVFVPDKHTKSQCSHFGHVAYTYRLRLVFPANARLNKKNIIVDHADLDELVVKTAASGTCEEMHPNICIQIRKYLEDRDIPLYGYKMTIQPGAVEGAAYMDYYYVAEELLSGVGAVVAMLG